MTVETRSSMKRSWVTRTRPPVELGQALLEHLERRDVEVVGRLVEDQQVGGLQHQARDEDARLLAAREAADRQPRAARGGRGSAWPTPRRGRSGPGRRRCRPPARAPGGATASGSSARAVLVEADDAQAVGALDRAGVGGEVAGEQPQQRGLAAAVRAEQADARAGREGEVEVARRACGRRAPSTARARRAACASGGRRRRSRCRRCRRRRAPRASPSSSIRRPASSMRRLAPWWCAPWRPAPQPLDLAPHACWRATPRRRPGRAGTRRGLSRNSL